MVSVRENLTALSGEITHRARHPTLPGFDAVDVTVAGAGPIEGKAQLVRPAPGDGLRITVRRELVNGVHVGARVRLRAALTSSGEVMAEPHPAPGDFVIL